MKDSIEKALKVIKEGGIILYPTDTVWGIGCDATKSEAVRKVFALKEREDAKSMLMLVGSDRQLQQYVKNIPDIAWNLLDAAVHPLTVIYDEPVGISPLLLAEDGSAGFRITNESFSKLLCQKLRRPIVSTSANISGMPTPHNFSEISDVIKNGVDYVVEIGRDNTKLNVPSNIIKVGNNSVIKIIR